ncbi:hypothetical protein CBR_g72156, partial [Chara braunii]
MAQQMQKKLELRDLPFEFTKEVTEDVDSFRSNMCMFLEKKGLHKCGLWQAECACASAAERVGEVSGWHLPASLAPSRDPPSVPNDWLRNWKEYYSWRELPLDSPAAILLHFPLTIYHCLHLAVSSHDDVVAAPRRSPPGQFAGQQLVVHLLGADKEVRQQQVFSELGFLLADVEVLLFMIGPAVPRDYDGSEVSLSALSPISGADEAADEVGSSSQQLGKGHHRARNVKVVLRRGLYHKLHSQLPEAALIVAMNAGLPAFPSWKPTLELVSRTKSAPVFFTDYCEEALHMSLQLFAAADISSLSKQAR